MMMESMLRTPGQSFDRVIVNWPELRVLNARGGLSPWRWAYVNLWLHWVRARTRQLVFVLHNHYAHDTTGRTQQASRALVARARSMADRVIVHAPAIEHWDNRHHYVPHPLYPTAVPDRSADFIESVGPLDDTYLIFGVIAEYKQLHHVLEIWPEQRRLLLAGSAPDASYVARLRALIRQRGLEASVQLLPTFISEAQAAYLLQQCRATLLLHDSEEMIASGSFFHAISYGATVLARARRWYVDIQSEFTAFQTFDDLAALAQRVAADDVARMSPAEVRANAERAFGEAALHDALRAALR